MPTQSSVIFFGRFGGGNLVADGDVAFDAEATAAFTNDVGEASGLVGFDSETTMGSIFEVVAEGDVAVEAETEFSFKAEGSISFDSEAGVEYEIFAPLAQMTIELEGWATGVYGSALGPFEASGDVAFDAEATVDLYANADIQIDGEAAVFPNGEINAVGDISFDAEMTLDPHLIPMVVALIPIEFDGNAFFGRSQSFGAEGNIQLDSEADVVNGSPPVDIQAFALILFDAEAEPGSIYPSDVQGMFTFEAEATFRTPVVATGDIQFDGEVVLSQDSALPPFCVESTDIFVPGAVAMEVCA